MGRVHSKMHSRKRHGAEVLPAPRSVDIGNVWSEEGRLVQLEFMIECRDDTKTEELG